MTHISECVLFWKQEAVLVESMDIVIRCSSASGLWLILARLIQNVFIWPYFGIILVFLLSLLSCCLSLIYEYIIMAYYSTFKYVYFIISQQLNNYLFQAYHWCSSVSNQRGGWAQGASLFNARGVHPQRNQVE